MAHSKKQHFQFPPGTKEEGFQSCEVRVAQPGCTRPGKCPSEVLPQNQPPYHHAAPSHPRCNYFVSSITLGPCWAFLLFSAVQAQMLHIAGSFLRPADVLWYSYTKGLDDAPASICWVSLIHARLEQNDQSSQSNPFIFPCKLLVAEILITFKGRAN